MQGESSCRVRSSQPPTGAFDKPTSGSPQGGIISPVLANIYLHYALDLRFENKVKPRLRGRAMMIRYADDFVCAFQHAQDAQYFYGELPKRLQRFNLDVAKEKTSLMRFSRFHPSRKRQFVFLSFAFYWGKDANGKARLRRRTAAQRQRSTLNALYHWIRAKRSRKLHLWLPELKRKLTGFSNYFGLPDNSRSLAKVSTFVMRSLHKWLNRRSGRRSYNWRSFKEMLSYFQIEPLRVRKRVIDVDWY